MGLRQCSLIVALVSLAVGFAPAPLPRAQRTAKQDDQTRLQGTWVMLRYEYAGSDTLPSYQQEVCLTFTGKETSYLVGGGVRSTWDFELSPGPSPRTMIKTARGGGFVIRGIYRFEGDRLFICESQNGEQPTSFGSMPRLYLIELRRR